MQPGDPFELATTPDRWLTVRYAGASGDFNPIHIDEEFARSVGLPGRILHGLWSMSQVARAHTEAFGGPDALAALSVQFRGLGLPEQEIRVTGEVTAAEDGCAVTRAEATQGETRIVRNARGEIRHG
jgi:acyl dehydratase